MKTVREQIECVDRELMYRKTAYPKWVRAGKMTQQKADSEIEAMSSVRNSLLLMPKEATLLAYK